MHLKCLLILSFLSFFPSFNYAQGNSPLPKVDKRFSVVAHIIEDKTGNPNINEQDILKSFDVLNENFSKIGMSFEVCEFRSIPNFQFDSLNLEYEKDQLHSRYGVSNRINMYFVFADQDKTSTVCGIASLNGIINPGAIYILKSCIGNNTISHEMGHFFGLVHTFNDFSNQLADESNCDTTGDKICDTPADPYDKDEDVAKYVDGCKFIFKGKDANGDFYNPLVSNIMSYYGCSCSFTDGQYRLMVKNYLNSIPYNW